MSKRVLSAEDAARFAKVLVKKEFGRELRVVAVRKLDLFPGEWAVDFELRTPEGSLVDSGPVVIVNAVSGEAYFL